MSNGPLIPKKVRGQGENSNIPYHIEMVRKVAEYAFRDNTLQLILQTHDFREYMKGGLISMIEIL